MHQSERECGGNIDSNGWPSRYMVDRVSSHLLAQSRGDSGVCSACNGYYGHAHGQPVCLTCHAFLYASGLDAENVNLQLMSEERDDENDSDRDSGNEEPNELFYAAAAAGNVSVTSDATKDSASLSGPIDVLNKDQQKRSSESEDVLANSISAPGNHRYTNTPDAQHVNNSASDDRREQDGEGLGERVANPFHAILEGELDPWNIELAFAPVSSFSGEGDRSGGGSEHDQQQQAGNHRRHHLHHVRVDTLSERLALLSMPLKYESNLDSNVPNEMVQALPNEVLMVIFSFLDDISLYAVGNVCRRWHQLLVSQTTSEQWQTYTRRRWPLFRPLCRVTDWFAIYSSLVESCFCLTCIYQMAEIIPEDINSLPLREKRLGHDLRGLIWDPPEGIKAQPLDSSYYHWQASITGPTGSPYEGGVFYLYLKVPFNYPFDPPEVRFLTRILHPNVSRHGDIGIDSILQHNWVIGLTIPKVLISIQSLLTDPYTEVCMEPEIGELYDKNRKMFESIARRWTWQFAMGDVLIQCNKPKIMGVG